jgi:hypothetical protein
MLIRPMSTLTAFLLVSAVVDGLVVGWALVGGAPRLEAVALRLATFGALWMARWMVLLGLGLEHFMGTLHLLYVDLVIGVPVAALVVLLRARGPGVARPLLAAAMVGLALAPIGAYGSLIEPERLVVERADVEVPPARAGEGGIRIGVLADLQTDDVGPHENDAVARLMALRPDLILIPGDLFDGTLAEREREREAMVRLLSRLKAPHGTFAVVGDVDPPDLNETLLRPAGIRLLRNEVARVRVADRRLSIVGVTKENPSGAAAAAALERESGDRDIRLLLGHRPDAVLRLARNTRIDLTVAGHTHGGQVQVPFFGPPITFSDLPRDVAAGGLHEVGEGRRLYISRGVGMERGQAPPVRIGAAPEVTLIELG